MPAQLEISFLNLFLGEKWIELKFTITKNSFGNENQKKHKKQDILEFEAKLVHRTMTKTENSTVRENSLLDQNWE